MYHLFQERKQSAQELLVLLSFQSVDFWFTMASLESDVLFVSQHGQSEDSKGKYD